MNRIEKIIDRYINEDIKGIIDKLDAGVCPVKVQNELEQHVFGFRKPTISVPEIRLINKNVISDLTDILLNSNKRSQEYSYVVNNLNAENYVHICERILMHTFLTNVKNTNMKVRSFRIINILCVNIHN